MLIDYIILIIYLVLLTILGYLLSFVSYLISPKENDIEKLSAYECGFNAFNDARSGYYVSFYIVALLYILFDIEITILFPWALSLYYQTAYSYLVYFSFLCLLTFGFAYEWKVGALEWR